jgi:protein-L-isoaspartate(D-aspartate) O-methyltransferase
VDDDRPRGDTAGVAAAEYGGADVTTGDAAGRKEMVRLLASRGITDRAVLAAMGLVPREAFLPQRMARAAYDDTSLPIERGQTISQPYIVALMTAALEPRPSDRVLEIGTGSGYAAAVLSRLVGEVYTVERHRSLAVSAGDRLGALGYGNVVVVHADGSHGLAEHAPYDGISVTAAPDRLPPALRDQLAIGGRLVVPVGPHFGGQTLLRVRRVGQDAYREEDLGPVRFVPLLHDTSET